MAMGGRTTWDSLTLSVVTHFGKHGKWENGSGDPQSRPLALCER